VHRLGADVPALVVVEVTCEKQDPIAIQAQATCSEHSRPRIVAETVGHHRVTGDEEDSVTRMPFSVPGEVCPLSEIDASELAIRTPKLELGSER
jgi:hypothetical protein